MTIAVPFDGSELSEAALVRAAEFDDVLEEGLLVITVVPSGNTEYARDRGWLDPDEQFDLETIRDRLETQAHDCCPEARFRLETVDRYAPSGSIANRIRQIGHEADASLVCLGSENAGHVVTTVSSVASTVASDDTYDLLVVRHPVETDN